MASIAQGVVLIKFISEGEITAIRSVGIKSIDPQIAQELDLNPSDSLYMAEILRSEVVRNKPVITLSDEVAFDEVYVIVGHQGRPKAIKGRKPRCNRLKGARGRGTLEKETLAYTDEYVTYSNSEYKKH